MSNSESRREELKSQVQVTGAQSLLPHQRRDGLLILRASHDLLDVALAIADDDSELIAGYLKKGSLYKPSLAELADWCVQTELRFQFIILQPYVLAQPIESARGASSS